MKRLFLLVLVLIPAIIFCQQQKVAGVYARILPGVKVVFNSDSTFEYYTTEMHPVFYRWENFSEKGVWIISGDTLILNPQLDKKAFVESEFREEQIAGESNLLFTFNHIRRYFDSENNLTRTDTVQIDRLDYSFNQLKKRNRTRVTAHRTSRCGLAGYIPKEIITADRTIAVQKPDIAVKSIFIGCYELQDTKEFILSDPASNHFTQNVYSNYYADGQIRQMKWLIKNENVLYTRQKPNGKFEKDNIWSGSDAKLKRQRNGS